MRVLIAIDSLKGSLTSIEAGNAIKDGILEVMDAEVTVKPLADGGEGTVDALLAGIGGERVFIEATGPMGDRINSMYGILHENKTAIIEMAEAAGIKLVPREQLNPLNMTTYGVGEIIKDAIKRGCRKFIVGIGGSATNDGGIGMLQALGYQFFDEAGNQVGNQGSELIRIRRIKKDHVMQELAGCSFKIACDVTNPLYGPYGASYVYGPQKGATPEMVEYMDNGMKNYAEAVKRDLGSDYSQVPGTGAAGGLGYAFLAFLGGKLESGINIIMDEVKMEEDIKRADVIITGEGKLDLQTSMGKAPVGIAKLAKKYNKLVIALAGGTTDDAVQCNKEGIDAYFSIMQLPMSVVEAMDSITAQKNLKSAARQVFRLIKELKEETADGVSYS